MQREVMRFILLTVIFLGFSANATNLCPVNDQIAEDMRINEQDFNKENAEKSVEYLSRIVNAPKTPFEWFSIPNATKFINGYALRRNAVLPKASKFHIDEFCRFYASEGWYYD